MVRISLVSALTPLYFYVSTFRSIIIIIIIIIIITHYCLLQLFSLGGSSPYTSNK
jgi:hypothetical protein